MSQVSKLAVRESDSSRRLRGAKPVRVSGYRENGCPNPGNSAAVVLVWNSVLLRKVNKERILLVGNLLIDDGVERSRKGLADFRPAGNSQCHDVAPIDGEALQRESLVRLLDIGKNLLKLVRGIDPARARRRASSRKGRRRAQHPRRVARACVSPREESARPPHRGASRA